MSLRNEIIIHLFRAHAEKYSDCPITHAWKSWNEQADIFEKMIGLLMPGAQAASNVAPAGEEPPMEALPLPRRQKSPGGKKPKRMGGVRTAAKEKNSGALTKKQAEALDMVIVLHKAGEVVNAKGLSEASEKSAPTCAAMLKTLHGSGFVKEQREGGKVAYVPVKNVDGSKLTA